jgi:hypothetical protein
MAMVVASILNGSMKRKSTTGKMTQPAGKPPVGAVNTRPASAGFSVGERKWIK